jgi:hypothetical protein
MPFQKGVIASPNGRGKGTPNRVTTFVKDAITNIIADNVDQIRLDLMHLEPRDRVYAFIQLCKVVLPKQKPLTIEEEQSNDLPNTIEIHFNQLDK